MNEFLKTKKQITEATKWLNDYNYTVHPISCKDWELKLFTEALKDYDLLDMGADGSFILHNAIKKGIKGRKVGIDLSEVTGDNKAEGVEYFKGDLMHTPFDDNSFDTIISASTIEHEVDLSIFATEVGRLLRKGGKLIVSFDYWPYKVDSSHIKLYGLTWNILDIHDVLSLVESCKTNGLTLTSEIDWTVQDKVINPQYCSPGNVEYSFGILEFIKK